MPPRSLDVFLILWCLTCHSLLTGGQAPRFYHTTDDISEELQNLAKSCPELSIRREPINDDNFIDVVSVSRSDKPVSRLFLLAGEHARELITSESALHFVKGKAWYSMSIHSVHELAVVLCGQESMLRDKAHEALNDTSFQVIVNGNPISRKNVEQGDFCVS